MLKRLVKGKLRMTCSLIALHVTKCIAQTAGRMTSNVTILECHLRLTVTQIQDRDKSFLLHVPLSLNGLFGEAVNVAEKYKESAVESG